MMSDMMYNKTMLKAIIRIFLAVACLAVTACGAPFTGTDDTGGDSGPGMTDPGGDSGPGEAGAAPDARDAGPGNDAMADARDAGPGNDACRQGQGLPTGWTLTEVSFGSTQATCGASFAGGTTVLHDTLSAPAPTCSCSCEEPTGVSCEIGISCTTSTCNDWKNTTTVTAGTCQNAATLCGGPYSVGASAPTTTGGSCAPKPSSTIPPTSWAETATACAPTTSSTACENLPVPDATFKLCAQTAGDVACPGGAWIDRHVEYASVDDTRSCSACTCGTPTGATCDGSFVTYGNSACSGSPTGAYAIPDSCTTVGNGSVTYQGVPSGGSCGAASVKATGSAAPAGATTFCCL